MDGGQEELADRLAAWRAQMDQAEQASKTIAVAVYRYMIALVELGFSSDEALVLTVAYQNQLCFATFGISQ